MIWPTKKLGEVVDYEQPSKYIVSSKNYNDKYKTPVLTAGKTFILGKTDERNNIFPAVKLPVIIFDDFTTATQFVDFPFKVKSSAMKILRPKRSLLDAKYLFYLMQTIKLNHSTHKRYWISEYSKIKMPIPPIIEQKKIVAKLESVLGKIKEARKFRQEAKAVVSTILPAELQKIFDMGKKNGWEEKSLNDESILKITSGGTPSRSNANFYQGSIVWLKSGELQDNTFITDSEEKISEEAIKKSSAKVFPKGTVLFAMYGATAGKIGILGVEASTNQAVAGIIPNKDKLDNKFLYYFFMNKREKIISHAWGGAQPNLSQTIIKKFQIPLPPLIEQKRIVAHLNLLSEKVKELHSYQAETSNSFKSLEQSILHKAFSGELVKEPVEVVAKRTSEQWFAIKQGVGAVLEKLAQTAYERGEMVVAKYMFFLQEIYKIPFGLHFVQHQFGPYDPDIKRAITASAFNKDKYFMVKGSGDRQVYSLGNNSIKLFNYTSNILANSRNSLSELMQYTATAKSSDIERLASVCKIVQDEQTIDEATIQQKMATWKPGKFTSEQIKKSLEFVIAKNWSSSLLNKI